jgi:hypothetical protein
MAIVAATATKDKKEAKQNANLEYMRKKYAEPVRGKFIFHEVPGGSMSFVYREFKGDQTERYDLVDGQIYTIPLGVARHLNKNCWYPVHQYAVDENGNKIQKIGTKVRRCSFQSLEFVDTEDLTPEGQGIITVENVIGE